MTDPLIQNDDTSGSFQAYREQFARDAAIQRMRERVRALPPGGEQAPPVPIDQQQGKPETGTLTGVKAAGSVLRNVAEIPAQLVGGVSDAVHNAFTGMDNLAKWLGEKYGDITLIEDDQSIMQTLAGDPDPAKRGISPAKTPVGGLAREAGRFLTGFVPALRATKALGLGTMAGGMAAGAASDFVTAAPDQSRLADMWKQAGLPDNVLTDWLAQAGNEDDSEAEKRFKTAVEGAGFGALADGVMLAARSIRSAARAKGTAAVEDVLQGVTDRDFLILGDPNKPLIEITTKAEPEAIAAARRSGKIDAGMEATEGIDPAAAAKGLSEDARKAAAGSDDLGGKQVFINFARINEPADVQKVIGDMADAFSGQIDAARRGVQTNEETSKLAAKIGMTPADLLNRRKGAPLNAEQALAARQLLNSSAEKLLEVAKVASGPNAGTIDLYNFRKMVSIHSAIQAEVIAARTETARALQSWAIPAGGAKEKLRSIENLMAGMGGPAVSKALADRLSKLAAAGIDDGALSAAIRRGAGARTVDTVREIFINGLLSSPPTHIVNTASNTMFGFTQIMERSAAAGIRQGIGGEGVAAGEATAMLFGLTSGLKDAFRASWKALKTGEASDVVGKVDAPQPRAISAEAWGITNTTAGRAVDLIGETVRVPGRALMVQDEFFKSTGYRMELHAQAWRTAHGEGLTGDAFYKRLAEVVDNPPENVRIAAADAALYSTFTNKTGWFGEAVMNLREKGGALNPMWLITPFVRTPVNLFRAFAERSPLAPLVGQWRDDIAAGGARADLAMARMATGSTIMLLATDLAMSGTITGRGPKDPGEREALIRQGWQPYSRRVGDTWVQYQRGDPLANTIGLAADFAELLTRNEIDPDDVDEWHEAMGLAIGAIAQWTVNRTYMSGMAELMNVTADPARYGRDYVNRLAGSFVPFSAGLGTVERAIDPTVREADDPFDYVQSRIAGLSTKLTPRRDLWGKAVGAETYFGDIGDAMSPYKVTRVKHSPIDAEMTRLNMNMERIGKRTSFDGVDVNFRDWPEVYDAYVRLAGNELEHPVYGVGAKDYLDSVIEGRADQSALYEMRSDGKDGGKAIFIRDTIQKYRALASREIMNNPEFADFADHVDRLKREKRQKRMLQ